LRYWFVSVEVLQLAIFCIACCIVNCVLSQFFPVIISTFDRSWYVDRYTGKVIHVIVRIFVYSSFCAVNSIFPVRCQNFAEVARSKHRSFSRAGIDMKFCGLFGCFDFKICCGLCLCRFYTIRRDCQIPVNIGLPTFLLVFIHCFVSCSHSWYLKFAA
jgi:hypothetical protein